MSTQNTYYIVYILDLSVRIIMATIVSVAVKKAIEGGNIEASKKLDKMDKIYNIAQNRKKIQKKLSDI